MQKRQRKMRLKSLEIRLGKDYFLMCEINILESF